MGIVRLPSGEILEISATGVKKVDGACEQHATCVDASEACHRGVFAETMVCDPAKRWMYCYAYKKKLGMVFDRELGIYILPEWKEELIRRANKCLSLQ